MGPLPPPPDRRCAHRPRLARPPSRVERPPQRARAAPTSPSSRAARHLPGAADQPGSLAAGAGGSSAVVRLAVLRVDQERHRPPQLAELDRPGDVEAEQPQHQPRRRDDAGDRADLLDRLGRGWRARRRRRASRSRASRGRPSPRAPSRESRSPRAPAPAPSGSASPASAISSSAWRIRRSSLKSSSRPDSRISLSGIRRLGMAVVLVARRDLQGLELVLLGDLDAPPRRRPPRARPPA